MTDLERVVAAALAPDTQTAIDQLRSWTGFDWLLAAILLWSVLRAFFRGLIRELFALAGLMVGILVAAWNYPAVALWLRQWIPSTAYAEVSAFLLLAVGASVATILLGRLVRSAARLVGLGLLDRFAGALFGAVRASLLGAAILMACTAFLPPVSAIQHSKLAPPLLGLARALAVLTPVSLQQRIASGMALLHRPGPFWH